MVIVRCKLETDQLVIIDRYHFNPMSLFFFFPQDFPDLSADLSLSSPQSLAFRRKLSRTQHAASEYPQ